MGTAHIRSRLYPYRSQALRSVSSRERGVYTPNFCACCNRPQWHQHLAAATGLRSSGLKDTSCPEGAGARTPALSSVNLCPRNLLSKARTVLRAHHAPQGNRQAPAPEKVAKASC